MMTMEVVTVTRAMIIQKNMVDSAFVTLTG